MRRVSRPGQRHAGGRSRRAPWRLSAPGARHTCGRPEQSVRSAADTRCAAAVGPWTPALRWTPSGVQPILGVLLQHVHVGVVAGGQALHGPLQGRVTGLHLQALEHLGLALQLGARAQVV